LIDRNDIFKVSSVAINRIVTWGRSAAYISFLVIMIAALFS
jgi:hypothetical protein